MADTVSVKELRRVLNGVLREDLARAVANELDIQLEPRKMERVGYLFNTTTQFGRESIMTLCKHKTGRAINSSGDTSAITHKDLQDEFGAYGGMKVKVTIEEVWE